MINLKTRSEKKLNLSVIEDDSNLEEVNGLVEWPNALVGEIDKKFMVLPREVLMSVMRVHQKYFALENRNKQILEIKNVTEYEYLDFFQGSSFFFS